MIKKYGISSGINLVSRPTTAFVVSRLHSFSLASSYLWNSLPPDSHVI